LSGTGLRTFIAQFGGSTNYGWWFGFNGTALSFFYSTTGTNNPAISGTYSLAAGAWVHYAVDRDASNVVRIYANGAVIASATVAAALFASTRNVEIGNDQNFTRGWLGTIDEARVTKGAAVYAGPFTPPTAPFGAAAGPRVALIM
jgi:hypothetical protein